MKQKCWCPDPTFCITCSLQTSFWPTCIRTAKLVRWLQTQMILLSSDFFKEHPSSDQLPLTVELKHMLSLKTSHCTFVNYDNSKVCLHNVQTMVTSWLCVAFTCDNLPLLSQLSEGTRSVRKYSSKYNRGNVRIRYSLQSTERWISFQKEWLFLVTRCCCDDFQPE